MIELEFELSRMQMKQPSIKLKLNDNINLRCGLRTLFYEPVHVNKRSEACYSLDSIKNTVLGPNWQY